MPVDALDEVGVISALSAPISAAQIPMLYLSTFHTAYIMVLQSDVLKAKMWLENAGYRLVSWQDKSPAVREMASLPGTPVAAVHEPSPRDSPRDTNDGTQFRLELWEHSEKNV